MPKPRSTAKLVVTSVVISFVVIAIFALVFLNYIVPAYQVTEDTKSLDKGVAATDAAGFRITVTVTDNGDGTLGIAVDYPNGGGGLTFRNTYGEGQTGQAMLNINGAKKLDVASGNNAPDITDKYTFTLTGSDGAPMPATTTATNDADGTVAFEKVEYTESGAHDYEIAEVKGDDSTITYDDTVFTVHVNVVDNTQTGSLDASDWSYGENGSPVFHNTYTEPPAPVEPDEVIPATGDAAVAAVAATVAIGGTLVAAGYVTSKKRGE